MEHAKALWLHFFALQKVSLTRALFSSEYATFVVARILKIFQFSWPYIQAYRWRFYAAIFAGVMFGVSNAGVLWLTQTAIYRLEPLDPPAASESNEAAIAEGSTIWLSRVLEGFSPDLAETIQAVWGRVCVGAEEWLDYLFPQMGVPVTRAQILGALLGLPILVAFRSAGQFFSAYLLSWVGEKMVNDLRVDVLDRLSGLSLGYFNQAKIGDMITRINGDTLMLQDCVSYGVRHSVNDPVTIISVFLYLLWTDWQLTLCVGVLLPICLVPVIVFGRKARRASKHRVTTNVTQASLIVELLSAIRVVKAYGLEDREVGRFRVLSKNLFLHTMKGIRAHEIVGPIIETVSMVVVGGLIVFVVQTQRDVPGLVTFFLGVVMFYVPVKKLAKLHVLFEQTSVGIDRLQGVLAEVPEVTEDRNAQPVQSFDHGLEFQNVSFSYGNDLVLKDINLKIPAGMRLGIAGESGSGKSTLINLLFRFFDPCSGSLRVDGHDLKELVLKDYRQLLALVSQDVVVFDQSVHDNIASGRLGASQEEVRAAARQAHATDFIEALPEGFDTRLGERGVTLSGGQRQRIAIARAFVRNAPILILDEATAALDAKSEGEVQSAIDDLTENRTVICIAHRLSTLKSMDSIVVLEQGRIVEQGTFDELVRLGGRFAQMAARQGIRSSE